MIKRAKNVSGLCELQGEQHYSFSTYTMATTPTLSRLLTRHVGIRALFTPTESAVTRHVQQRSYAKKTKKKGGAATESSEPVENIARAFDESKLQERMDSTIASLKENFKTLQVGRANPGKLGQLRPLM